MARAKPTILKTLTTKFPDQAKLLLAVSGGVDSISLLHGAVLVQEKTKKNLKLEVLHFDHALRPDSREDAKFVRAEAKKLGLTCHVQRAKNPPKTNIEAWARTQRYDFFAKILKKRKFDWIVTAHNADDLAETLLMRLLDGRSLRGIEQVDQKRKLLRPLLSVRREEIEDFVLEHKLTFRTDPSNLNLRFTRNKIRHKLLPALKADFSPSVAATLVRQAEQLSYDAHYLDSLANKIVLELSSELWGAKTWLRALKVELVKLDPAIAWRVVEQVLLQKIKYRIGFVRSFEVLDFIWGERKALELGSGARLEKRSSGLVALINK